jgi:cytochrome c oxidase cbb3-type subunit 3
MGPPLIKENWIYGGEPANIFDTIVKGRPNGMPAWGGKIPEYQIWQLVAYVRSMNHLEPRAASSTRSDEMEQNSTAIRGSGK